MLETEYIRSLHCNYERIFLPEKPEEKRFQYCMINRGGIRGLLSCSLRYLDGNAYLYYDITSRQNVSQLFQRTPIKRDWLLDFIDSIQHLREELERFLLQEDNILWEPEQIFQDLEKNEFSFVYVPYYEGENQFLKLLSFLVEHIDYDDEELVECVYQMYEQMEKNGELYLQEKIFRDVEMLAKRKTNQSNPIEQPLTSWVEEQKEEEQPLLCNVSNPVVDTDTSQKTDTPIGKKGLLGIFDSKRSRNKEMRDTYREEMQQRIDGYAVAEANTYEEEEFGQTVYLDMPKEERKVLHRIYSSDGRILAQLDGVDVIIGKAKDRVDIYLEDISVSRLHAKIHKKKEDIALEDLNSTNGTFLNGERLKPYEKRRIETGDEIRCGKIVLQYR